MYVYIYNTYSYTYIIIYIQLKKGVKLTCQIVFLSRNFNT